MKCEPQKDIYETISASNLGPEISGPTEISEITLSSGPRHCSGPRGTGRGSEVDLGSPRSRGGDFGPTCLIDTGFHWSQGSSSGRTSAAGDGVVAPDMQGVMG